MTTSYDNFIWRETVPGVWQRDIDEAEMFYASLAKLYEGSNRMFFAITGHVSLRLVVGQDEILREKEQRFDDALRIAWLRLRSEQPAIASKVAYDADLHTWRKTYRTIHNSDDRNSWLKSTFRKVSTGQTGLEWCNSDPPAPDLPTLFAIHPPRLEYEGIRTVRRDIVLRSPHDIIDGIGTLHLLNLLVNITTNAYLGEGIYQYPAFGGEEVNRLSAPYRIAANIPPVPTPEHQRRLDDMAEASSKGDNEPEIIGLPYKFNTVIPGKHQRVARSLSKDQTALLLSRCKAVGATVTHAYHAAIAIILRDMQVCQSEPRRVQYVTYILKNERSSCINPYNTANYAAAVCHSVSSRKLAVPMTLPAFNGQTFDARQRKDEFFRIMNIMKDFYHDVQTDPVHSAIVPYIWAANTPVITSPEKTDSSRPIPPPRLLAQVSISSMGNIDKFMASEIDPFQLENPWVTGEELGNGLGLFLGTFRGQLSLSAAYNDAWHDEESSSNFLRCCEEIVLESFGI